MKKGYFLLESIISIFLIAVVLIALVTGISSISKSTTKLRDKEITILELKNDAESLIGTYYKTGVLTGDFVEEDLGGVKKIILKKEDDKDNTYEIILYLKENGIYTDWTYSFNSYIFDYNYCFI